MTAPDQYDLLTPELQQRVREVSAMPTGEARARAAADLLDAAQASGSWAAEFVARAEVTEAEYYLPDDPAHLVHIAWFRTALDQDRDLSEFDRQSALWRLKWAPAKMLGITQIPAATIERAIDDLAEIYRSNGVGARPVLQARAAFALQRGDLAAVAAAMAEFATIPRDALSDCHACEVVAQARASATVEPTHSIDLLAPVIAGRISCDSAKARAPALDARLRAEIGDEDAVDAVRHAWGAVRDRVDHAAALDDVLTALVLLGNPDRALDNLLPRLTWRDNLRAADERLAFLRAAILVLDASAARGYVPEQIDGRPWASVRDEFVAEAERVATAFDERNGTTHQQDLLRTRIALARDEREPTLPPTRIARAEPARHEGSTRGPRLSVAEHAASIRRAQAAVDPGVGPLVRDYLDDRDALLAAGPSDSDDTAWLADVAYLDRLASTDAAPERAYELLSHAIDAAERAGTTIEARRSTVLRGLLATEAAALASALADARMSAEQLERDGEWMHAAATWRSIAQRCSDPVLAIEASRASARCSQQGGDPVRAGIALIDAAGRALTFDDSIALLDEATRLVGRHTARVAVDSMRWRIVATHGDLDTATALVRELLADAELPDALRWSERAALCDLLITQERYDELAAEALPILAAAKDERDPALLALGQRYLGLAYVETGRYLEGAELLEAALPVIAERAPEQVGPLGWALGNGLRGAGQLGPARTAYARAAVAYESAGRIGETGHAQYRAGDAAWDLDDFAAATAHFERAIECAHEVLDVSLCHEARRGLAAVTMLSGDHNGVEDGLAMFDALPDELRELGAREVSWRDGDDQGDSDDGPRVDFDAMRASILRQQAHILGVLGRPADALDRIAERAGDITDGSREAIELERGALLAEAERFDEAELHLRQWLPAYGAADDAFRMHIVQRWARALDAAGRTDDADSVWSEFGATDV